MVESPHREHRFACRLWDAGLGRVPFICLLAGEEPVHAHIPGTIIPLQETANWILRLMGTLIQHGDAGTPAHPAHIVIPPVWFKGAGIPERESLEKGPARRFPPRFVHRRRATFSFAPPRLRAGLRHGRDRAAGAR